MSKFANIKIGDKVTLTSPINQPDVTVYVDGVNQFDFWAGGCVFSKMTGRELYTASLHPLIAKSIEVSK